MLDEGGGKASLAQMDGDGVGSDLPLEVNAKEPFDGVHEIDLEVLRKKALELLLDCRVRGEVDEVINTQP